MSAWPATSPRFAAISFVALALVFGLATGQVQPPALTPDEAVKAMQVADGFQVKVVAAEPLVRKPVTMSFDGRGRLWVIQYLQYPSPAGLKAVTIDQYLRTTYDRIPEPPPKGPKGADRITILEDPDATGRFRKAKDFHVGMNLASGMCLGHGGVFVAQPPYLLFYADRDRDDKPDGDPEVLLSGFGMEDAHAFPNSLQWGPDGWLYGAQGSTVTSNVRGIEFQQGIWRYHPRTKEFELFAEGGGNTWGVDFDRHGNLLAGTNWGGQALLHQVQGGYYVKGFGKHGPLHNPHTFGYFEHVPYQGFKGGHVTCGGIVYTGDSFPEQYRNQYIACNLLSNALYWHRLEAKGSTFAAKHGGDLAMTADTWFRPVDLLVGPDGSVYVADWCDKRANHVDPVDNWDRTKGRIYKIEANGTKPVKEFNLDKLASKDLLPLLKHPNDWYTREARRILAERRDNAVIPDLTKLVRDNKDQLAVEALWALYVSGGFTDALAGEFLNHANDAVRVWSVRFLGDAKKVSPALCERLIATAKKDPSAAVRSQLACSSKRLPAKDGLAIVRELLQRSEDVDDPHIPMLLWWAIEDKAISDRDLVLSLLDQPAAWQSPIIARWVVERLGRRYMAGGTDADLRTCTQLFDGAPGPAEVDALVRGMEKALEGRHFKKVPATLEQHLTALTAKQPKSLTLLRFALRLGSEPAYHATLRRVNDTKSPVTERIGLIEILGQMGKEDSIAPLLKLLPASEDAKVRLAALSALQPFPDAKVAAMVLELYPTMPTDMKARAQTLLCNRAPSALAFLKSVDAGRIRKEEVPLDQLQRIALFKNKELTALLEKHWGKIGAQSNGEKRSRMASIRNILRNGKGNADNGKTLFTKHCATCHTLHGAGNKIGPDLTTADRKNLDFLLTSIVDPSAFIRPEFVAYSVETKDGRVLTGLVVESSPKSVTLLNAKNEKIVLSQDAIEEMNPSSVSLMPEGILNPLDDQEIRDLLGYLQSNVMALGGR